jgi:CubicO group peptidase (beta-lactamase class C family)
MNEPESPAISGFAQPRFEGVKAAFVDNFRHRDELGAACCVYDHGEKVVDLWGGIRNKVTREPWEEHTMVFVASTTKGLAAMVMALAQSRGYLDYEERVCTYWPEFAQNGKENVTVRQLLAHQAGLFALDAPVDRGGVADLDRLAEALAAQKPAWEPGTRQAYHAITLGFYEGELVRRVDPRHRSLGQFFQDEIATPLGLDFYIRLPEDIPNARLAVVTRPDLMYAVLHPNPFVIANFNPRSPTHKAFWKNPGVGIPFEKDLMPVRNLEVPSQGGVGSARAIAHAYSVFATGGHELGLRPETLQALMAPAIPPLHGFFDEVMRREWQLSLGFAKPDPGFPFGSPSAFGTPGSGGSLGFADPQSGIGYAYVMNRLGSKQGTDPRELALREALHQATGQPVRAAEVAGA